MIESILKQNKDLNNEENLILIGALFVHAARMDENYTDKEKAIILKALPDFQIKRKEILKSFLMMQK